MLVTPSAMCSTFPFFRTYVPLDVSLEDLLWHSDQAASVLLFRRLFSIRYFFPHYRSQALNLTRQDGKRHITFESSDAEIRALAQTVNLQGIDDRLHCRLLVTQKGKVGSRLALSVMFRKPAFFGNTNLRPSCNSTLTGRWMTPNGGQSATCFAVVTTGKTSLPARPPFTVG